jgi:Ca2+-binding RTX toxin-like protein
MLTVSLLFLPGAIPSADAECAPQIEIVDYYQYSDGAGFHDVAAHSAPDPQCPIDFYSTPKEDQYRMGSVMPTFHFNDEGQGNYDGIVHITYAMNLDFSGYPQLYNFSLLARNYPYDIVIKGTDGYNDLNNKAFIELPTDVPLNVNDAKVTWYALDGEDRIEGGSFSVDVAYGGLGNDFYVIANNEDRALENDGEGFDVVAIGTGAQNYRFDYKTSIEAIYLYGSGTVDMNYLPPGVIFLNRFVENRGGRGGGSISDYLNGTDGNDGIVGGDLNQVVNAEAGTDFVDGGAGNDSIDGGAGNDVIYGGSGNDNVNGGTGNDLIVGGSGEGNDTYVGGEGIDTVKYTSAKAAITVNLSLKMNQAYSSDTADGAKIGIDQLAQIENVIAGNYDDLIVGSKLSNRLEGEDGRDTIRGERGNDILVGGKGGDILIGGAGTDNFIYAEVSDSGTTPDVMDTITDFSVGKEKIDLSQIDASTILDGNNAFMFNGASPIGTSSEGEISIVRVDNPGKSNDYMMIYLDTDADPDPEAAIRVNKLLKLSMKNLVL